MVPIVGERAFLTDVFQFFVGILDNLVKERKENQQVT